MRNPCFPKNNLHKYQDRYRCRVVVQYIIVKIVEVIVTKRNIRVLFKIVLQLQLTICLIEFNIDCESMDSTERIDFPVLFFISCNRISASEIFISHKLPDGTGELIISVDSSVSRKIVEP